MTFLAFSIFEYPRYSIKFSAISSSFKSQISTTSKSSAVPSTSFSPQSAHTVIPSRYSVLHFGHHIVFPPGFCFVIDIMLSYSHKNDKLVSLFITQLSQNQKLSAYKSDYQKLYTYLVI